MPLFGKKASPAQPAAPEPPPPPVDELLGDPVAHRFRAELAEGRWQEFHDFAQATTDWDLRHFYVNDLSKISGRPGWLDEWVAARPQSAIPFLFRGSHGINWAWEAHVTVRYDSVAALLHWNDGKQALVGTDGFAVQLDPDEWPDGPAVLADVASHVNPAVIVPVDAPGPVRPRRRPAGSGAAESETAGSGSSRPTGPPASPRVVVRRRWPARVFRAACVLSVITGIFAVAGGDLSGGAGFVVVGVAGLAWQEFQQRRRQHRPQ